MIVHIVTYAPALRLLRLILCLLFWVSRVHYKKGCRCGRWASVLFFARLAQWLPPVFLVSSSTVIVSPFFGSVFFPALRLGPSI